MCMKPSVCAKVQRALKTPLYVQNHQGLHDTPLYRGFEKPLYIGAS